jgi:uncharacterized protein YhaN
MRNVVNEKYLAVKFKMIERNETLIVAKWAVLTGLACLVEAPITAHFNITAWIVTIQYAAAMSVFTWTMVMWSQYRQNQEASQDEIDEINERLNRVAEEEAPRLLLPNKAFTAGKKKQHRHTELTQHIGHLKADYDDSQWLTPLGDPKVFCAKANNDKTKYRKNLSLPIQGAA